MQVLGRSTSIQLLPFSCSRRVSAYGMGQVMGLAQQARQHLPGRRGVSSTAQSTAVATAATTNKQLKRVRLAVVGDVHGQWGPADAAALKALQADAVLWVGDIGNEDIGLVQQIAAVGGADKAVILGNHDAWYTMTARGRQRAQKHAPPGSSPPSSPSSTRQQTQQQQPEVFSDRVQQQLDVLGRDHVGYGHKELRGTNISVVGARPFSKGGQDFSSMSDFLSRFGVSSMQQSADKILDIIHTQVPSGNVLVVMAHNGPAGLGSSPHSICGCDWLPEAGDHGDPDLQLVLQQLQEGRHKVALLLHGHMHHMIKGGGRRQMVHVDPASGLVVLNAATVPRVVPLPHSNGSAAASRHHFLVVELQDGVPACAADVWVHTQQHTEGSSSSKDPAVLAQQRNFLAATTSAMHAVQHNKSKNKTAKQAAAKAAQEEAVRRVQLQAPVQLQLSEQQQQQRPQVVDGFQVHLAEVYEVLRALQPEGPQDDGAEGTQQCVQSWQYFDAHLGRWISCSARADSAADVQQAQTQLQSC